MTQPTQPAIAIVDLETGGLDPALNAIFEVGILLLDIELNEVASFSSIVADPFALAHLQWLEGLAMEEPAHRNEEPWRGARIVYEMHERSDLAAEIRGANGTGPSLAVVEQQAVEFLRSWNVGPTGLSLPMTGSSILFDRQYIQAQMPQLNALFHYRNTDISSIKNLVNLYRMDLVALRNQSIAPAGLHRSLPDCRDTALELEFYLQELFAKKGGL